MVLPMLFCIDVFKVYEVNLSPEALGLAAGEGSRLKKHGRQKVLEPIANWEKGNLHSFLATKGIFKKDLILCMGDHIFDCQM